MARVLQSAFGTMPTEEIRRIVGDAPTGGGALRRNVGHIRANRQDRAEQIGTERYWVFCEAFGIDPLVAMQEPVRTPRIQGILQ